MEVCLDAGIEFEETEAIVAVCVPLMEEVCHAGDEFLCRELVVGILVAAADQGLCEAAEAGTAAAAGWTEGEPLAGLESGGESGQLFADGFGSVADKRFDGLEGFAVEGAEGGPRDEFTGDDAVEGGQFLLRFLADGGSDGSGDFVHLCCDAVGVAEGLGDAVEFPEVELFEFLDAEHAFEEGVSALPGVVDAEMVALFLGGAIELAPGAVLVPWDELEQLGFGVEVEIEVLARAEEAVYVREIDHDGEEAGELGQVDVVMDAGGEGGIVCVGDEVTELDEAPFLFGEEGGFGIVDLAVGVPVGAEVGEE